VQGTVTWFNAEIFKDGRGKSVEDAVENENEDAGNGFFHREDSQSTSVHCEYSNALMDICNEVSTKNQQDSVNVKIR
jgi:hypothetical protein